MAVSEELLRNIRSVEPYVPGEQPQHKVVKLNTNENPYPPAPGVERVLKEMDTDRFRLYPERSPRSHRHNYPYSFCILQNKEQTQQLHHLDSAVISKSH